MGPKKLPDHEYSFMLNQYPELLRNGSYIRARMKDGSWQELQTYSKHKQRWFNVLRTGEDIPQHSIQLLNGGRWYQISGPGEWIPSLEDNLEASSTSVAPINTSLPTIEDLSEPEDTTGPNLTVIAQTQSEAPDDEQQDHPGQNTGTNPFNSTTLYTPRLTFNRERPDSGLTTTRRGTGADDPENSPLIPNQAEPRRKVIPSLAELLSPNSLEGDTVGGQEAANDSNGNNFPIVPYHDNDNDQWDDVTASLILNYEKQGIQLANTSRELLCVKQACQQVEQQIQDLQAPPTHLAITQGEMMTKQTRMEDTITTLTDERDQSNAEYKRLLSREQELLKALSNRDIELREVQEHLSSTMENGKLAQIETTKRINQLVINAQERETNVQRVMNDLTKKINQNETQHQDLAHGRRVISQLEPRLAACNARLNDITRNENVRIKHLEAQLRDSKSRNQPNQLAYQPPEGTGAWRLGERSGPLITPYPRHEGNPFIPIYNRNQGQEDYSDLVEENHSSYTMEPHRDIRRHARSSQQLTDVRSHLEEIGEFNEDITKMIKEAKSTLDERQDGFMKDFRRTMSHEYNKLKDSSRRTKYAFKRELRRYLPETESEEAIDNEILICNTSLLQEAGNLLTKLDDVIKSRGLNLSGIHNSKDYRIEYPTFSGQTLPLVGDFLEELAGLLVQAGVPVSGRGAILAQSVKGQAKNILSNGSLERNPSFESQAEILREHFGDAGTQMDLVLRLHKSHGTIPSSHDLKHSMSAIYNIVKNHMTLLKAASSLHQQYTNGSLAENPITGSYLNALEQFLPRTKREVICDALEYQILNTADRFKKLREAYHQIQHFASTEVARHGCDIDQVEPKRIPRFPNLITNQDTPPAPQLPLLQTKNTGALRPLSDVQCFKCNQFGHYANSCPSAHLFTFCTTCQRSHLPGLCTPRPPSQLIGLTPQKARPSTLVHKPDGTIFTHVEGESIQLQRIEPGPYFSGIITCFVCKALNGTPGIPASPSMHIFTLGGKLERYLCPSLTSIPTMEDRVFHLDKNKACRACLGGYTLQPSHNGKACQMLMKTEGVKHLKCSDTDCRVRYTLCVEHKTENRFKIQEYIQNIGDGLKVNISMALTTKSREDVSSLQQTAIRKLVNQCLHRVNTIPIPSMTMLITKHNEPCPILTNISQLLRKPTTDINHHSGKLSHRNPIFKRIKNLIEDTSNNEDPHHSIMKETLIISPDLANFLFHMLLNILAAQPGHRVCTIRPPGCKIQGCTENGALNHGHMSHPIPLLTLE